VPKENRLDKEGSGFKVAMKTLDVSRPFVAAAATGLARAALEYAVKYSKERVQFGQPISQFQAIQFMLADMAQRVEASRLLTWQAAWALDQGKQAAYYSSIAKCFADDTAMSVTTDAVQIYGGYGYMKE
jgi:alkylation response protein AidB-like acyl-CoA dehydrogenase